MKNNVAFYHMFARNNISYNGYERNTITHPPKRGSSISTSTLLPKKTNTIKNKIKKRQPMPRILFWNSSLDWRWYSFFFLRRLLSANQEQELKPCTKFYIVFMAMPFSRKCGNIVESYQRTEFCPFSCHIDPQVRHVCTTSINLDHHETYNHNFWLGNIQLSYLMV